MPWTGAVLPALPGISYPQQKTVNWPKVEAKALSGKRARQALQTYPTYSYQIPLNYLRTTEAIAEFQALMGFVNSLAGGVGLFGYTDPDDSTVADETFAEGDGTTKGPYQLVRGLGGFTEPVFLLNGSPTIMVAGVQTSAFTVDPHGRVTFDAAPAAGAQLSWTGSYYWPCRFDDDTLDFEKFVFNMYSVKALKFSTEKL